MLINRALTMLAPDGQGGGGSTDPQNQEPTADAAEQQTIEQLQAELSKLKEEKKKAEEQAEKERKAKMTEEEKRKAEIDEARKSLHDQHIELQMKSSGLDEEYKSLFIGSTVEEIKEKGSLISKLIDKIKAETEADVKKSISKTGAPGAGTPNEEMTAEAFYDAALRGQGD